MQEMHEQGNSTEGKELMAAMNLEGQGREQAVIMAEGAQRSNGQTGAGPDIEGMCRL